MAELIALSKLHLKLASLVPDSKALSKRLNTISRNVDCPHNESEVLSFGIDVLSFPRDIDGCIVEAGAYKGGSTAKISLFAKLAGREFIVFDSFEGLPANTEKHDKSILGHSIKETFAEGKFCGFLEEVKKNIERYGGVEVCTFVKGWFEETLPMFSKKIAMIYLDVDLASSTKTCLKYLYPLVVPGGIIYSQDGDFPLVIEVFNDDKFWENEVGCKKPDIEGLGKKKLLKIIKEN